MSRYELTDKVLWLLVPLALVASYYGSYNLLQQVKDASISPLVEETTTPKKVDDDAEDHIPPDALRKLSDGHSFELRKAAFRIALSQSLKPEAKKALLKDLASKNSDRRDNAVFALWYLIHGPNLNEEEYSSTRLLHQGELQQLATYQAIVTALVNLLPLHVQSGNEALSAGDPPPSPIRPLRRPTHEATLMSSLVELIRAFNRNPSPEGGVHTALEAGLVHRWLARYPFPCTLPQYSKLNFKRSDVSDLLLGDNSYARDDYWMAEIFRQINSSPTGRAQLRGVGLVNRHSRLKEDIHSEHNQPLGFEDWANIARSSQLRSRDTEANVNEFTNNVNDDTHSGTSAWRSFHPPVRNRSIFDLTRPENSTQTEEEFRQRRRNREAVVVADPDTSPQARAEESTTRRNNSIEAAQNTAAEGSTEVSSRRPRQVAASRVSDANSNNANEDDAAAYAASHLSFSSAGSINTPDSLPGLMTPSGEQEQTAERLNEAELTRQLSALQCNERDQHARTRHQDQPPSMGDLVETAVRARERSRLAELWRDTEPDGGGSARSE